MRRILFLHAAILFVLCLQPADARGSVTLTKLFEDKQVKRLSPVHGSVLDFSKSDLLFTFGDEGYKVPISKINSIAGNHTVLRKGRHVHFLKAFGNTLYSIDKSAKYDPATWNGYLFTSSDGGKTFKSIDKNLQECVEFDGQKYCSPLTEGNNVQMIGNKIFYSAGNYPNLFVTSDNGNNWTPILGSIQNSIGTNAAFNIFGRMLYISSDVNDIGEFKQYQLSQDLLALDPPAQTGVDLVSDLGYSQAYLIKQRPGTQTIYSGMEGGLVRGTLGKRDWKFNMKLNSFIQHIEFLDAKTILIAGNLKMGGYYLGISRDDGKSWLNLSSNLEKEFKKIDAKSSRNKMYIRALSRGPNNKIFIIYHMIGGMNGDQLSQFGKAGLAELIVK